MLTNLANSSKRKALLLFVAILITYSAAFFIQKAEPAQFILTSLIFFCGAVLFVISSRQPTQWTELQPKENLEKRKSLLLWVSVFLSVVSFIFFWVRFDNAEQFVGVPFLLWVLSIIVLLAGIFDFRLPVKWSEYPKIKKNEALIVVAIIAVSLFLRVNKIEIFPNGCQTDECNNGLEALKFLQGKPYAPYAEVNEGQATMFTYFLALAFKLFGVGVTQMRLVSAVVGSLTIGAFYFLAKDILKWPYALAATSLFSVARWHLTFSRIVYELILAPLAEILVILFLLRALKNGRRQDWVFAGLSLAFGMNTYTAFRIFPILVGVYLIFWVIQHRERIRRDVEGILYLVLGLWTGMIPLSVYILQHWGVFMGRTSHISIINDIENAGGSLQPLFENIKLTIWSFYWKGDWAALNNLPQEPHLDIVVRVLFLFGIAYSIRYIRQPIGLLFISWVAAIISLAIFSTVNEAPTARRTIGLLPVIYLMSGLVLQLIFETVSNFLWADNVTKPERTSRWERYFLGSVVLLVAVININTFFNIQAKNISVWNAYSATEAAIGKFMRDLPDDSLILLDPAYNFHSAVLFISNSRPYTILNLSEHLPIINSFATSQNIHYILPASNSNLENTMRLFYPQGKWEVHKDLAGNPMFYTFEVSAETLEMANHVVGEYYSGNDVEGEPVVSRQEKTLSYLWDSKEATPLPAPFSAKWSGSIYFPYGHGDYSFLIQTDGNAELFIDGDSILVTQENQLISETVELVSGFHTFVLTYTSGIDPKELTLSWKKTNTEFVAIPPNLLFNIPLLSNGLTGYYYPNGDMTGLPSLIQHDLFISSNNPLPEPNSIIWKGRIKIPETGEYIFGTVSDDGSFLFIDNELIVDSGGSHGGEERQGSLFLSSGLHDLEIQYWQLGGGRVMEFWWLPPWGGKEIVPLEFLYPD